MAVESKADQWSIVEEVIRAWVKRHPTEWQDFILAMAHRRRQLDDAEFGQSKDKRMREVGAFPEPASFVRNGKKQTDNLMEYIERVLPEFTQQDDKGRQVRARFFQNFPAFRVAKKV